jgi:hypothetical protein
LQLHLLIVDEVKAHGGLLELVCVLDGRQQGKDAMEDPAAVEAGCRNEAGFDGSRKEMDVQPTGVDADIMARAYTQGCRQSQIRPQDR